MSGAVGAREHHACVALLSLFPTIGQERERKRILGNVGPSDSRLGGGKGKGKFYIQVPHSLKRVDFLFQVSSFILMELKIIDTVYASTPYIFPSCLITDPRTNWLLKIK